MDSVDEHMKSIRLTQKRIQSDLNSALVWKNMIAGRYRSECERRDKLLKAERYNSLQSLPRDREKMYQLLQEERFKNQLKDQEYEKSKEDIIKECEFYKTRLMDIEREKEELLERTRILETEKEKMALELTKAKEECKNVRDLIELKSARTCPGNIIETQQQNIITPIELSKRTSSSSTTTYSSSNKNIKQSKIQSTRRKSTQSSISNALPNLINSYEEEISNLSTKLEYLQNKYDKDMSDCGSRYRRLEKAYDDLRSRYTKVQADFIEKEYCF